jgi:uncharacterized protein (DUF1697 family)
VGGHKRVDMAGLRAVLTGLGYTDVRTYLQSGNAVFTSRSARGATSERLEDAIAQELGVDCRAIVRTKAQLDSVMRADPLLDYLGDPSRHMIGFLSDPPSPDGTGHLTERDFGPDQLRIVNEHLYLWCPNGLTASPFNKLDFDRILGSAVTLRNWNTVTKVAEMSLQGS